MMDTLTINQTFSDLALMDIMVGGNGVVTLLAMMGFALLGNLFKKYQRFKRKPDTGSFRLGFWLRDNWQHMAAGALMSYLCARLVNLIIPFLSEVLPPSMDVSELVIVVGLYIGYKLDDIEDAVAKRLALKK